MKVGVAVRAAELRVHGAPASSFWSSYQKKMCAKHPDAGEICVQFWSKNRALWTPEQKTSFCEWQPQANLCHPGKNAPPKKEKNPCKPGYSYWSQKHTCFNPKHSGRTYKLKGDFAPTDAPTYGANLFQDNVCKKYPLAGQRCVKYWPGHRHKWKKAQLEQYCEWWPRTPWCEARRQQLVTHAPTPRRTRWRQNWRPPSPAPTPSLAVPPTRPPPPPPTRPPPTPPPTTPQPVGSTDPWLGLSMNSLRGDSSPVVVPTPYPTVKDVLLPSSYDDVVRTKAWRADPSTTIAPTPLPTSSKQVLDSLRNQMHHLAFVDNPTPAPATAGPKPVRSRMSRDKMRLYNRKIFSQINAVQGGGRQVHVENMEHDAEQQDTKKLQKLREAVHLLQRKALQHLQKKLVKTKVAVLEHALSAQEAWSKAARRKHEKDNVVVLDFGGFHGAQKKRLSGKLRGGPLVLDGSHCWSLTAWIKTRHSGTIFSEAPAVAQPQSRVLYVTGLGVVSFALTSAGGSHEIVGSTLINDGAWHHVVAAYDCVGHTITLFVDGSEDGRRKFELGSDPGFPLRAGYGSIGFPPLQNYFRGAIQSLVYRR